MEIETIKSQRFNKLVIEAYDSDPKVYANLNDAIKKRAEDVLADVMERALKTIKYFGSEVNIRVSVTIDDKPLDEEEE